MRIVFIGLAGLLASCSTVLPSDTASVPQSSFVPVKISYSTGPCFGTCPIYSVTVTANGQGRWEGERFVVATGERAFTVTPEQMARFTAALQPYRPKGSLSLVTAEECNNNVATDLPTVDVFWTAADGREDHLSYYYGCDLPKNAKIGDGLRAAINILPIQNFIGK